MGLDTVLVPIKTFFYIVVERRKIMIYTTEFGSETSLLSKVSDIRFGSSFRTSTPDLSLGHRLVELPDRAVEQGRKAHPAEIRD